jgi:hypothetical protein
MDTPAFLLSLVGCFLLAGTIVTAVAILRAPMGIETEDGFVEEQDSPHEHAAMPGALRFR